MRERDQDLPSTQQGLFNKYSVVRVDGKVDHEGAEYFVLRLDGLDERPADSAALAAYCTASYPTHPMLAAALASKLPPVDMDKVREAAVNDINRLLPSGYIIGAPQGSALPVMGPPDLDAVAHLTWEGPQDTPGIVATVWRMSSGEMTAAKERMQAANELADTARAEVDRLRRVVASRDMELQQARSAPIEKAATMGVLAAFADALGIKPGTDAAGNPAHVRAETILGQIKSTVLELAHVRAKYEKHNRDISDVSRAYFEAGLGSSPCTAEKVVEQLREVGIWRGWAIGWAAHPQQPDGETRTRDNDGLRLAIAEWIEKASARLAALENVLRTLGMPRLCKDPPRWADVRDDGWKTMQSALSRFVKVFEVDGTKVKDLAALERICDAASEQANGPVMARTYHPEFGQMVTVTMPPAVKEPTTGRRSMPRQQDLGCVVDELIGDSWDLQSMGGARADAIRQWETFASRWVDITAVLGIPVGKDPPPSIEAFACGYSNNLIEAIQQQAKSRGLGEVLALYAGEVARLSGALRKLGMPDGHADPEGWVDTVMQALREQLSQTACAPSSSTLVHAAEHLARQRSLIRRYEASGQRLPAPVRITAASIAGHFPLAQRIVVVDRFRMVSGEHPRVCLTAIPEGTNSMANEALQQGADLVVAVDVDGSLHVRKNRHGDVGVHAPGWDKAARFAVGERYTLPVEGPIPAKAPAWTGITWTSSKGKAKSISIPGLTMVRDVPHMLMRPQCDLNPAMQAVLQRLWSKGRTAAFHFDGGRTRYGIVMAFADQDTPGEAVKGDILVGPLREDQRRT